MPCRYHRPRCLFACRNFVKVGRYYCGLVIESNQMDCSLRSTESGTLSWDVIVVNVFSDNEAREESEKGDLDELHSQERKMICEV